MYTLRSRMNPPPRILRNARTPNKILKVYRTSKQRDLGETNRPFPNAGSSGIRKEDGIKAIIGSPFKGYSFRDLEKNKKVSERKMRISTMIGQLEARDRTTGNAKVMAWKKLLKMKHFVIFPSGRKAIEANKKLEKKTKYSTHILESERPGPVTQSQRRQGQITPSLDASRTQIQALVLSNGGGSGSKKATTVNEDTSLGFQKESLQVQKKVKTSVKTIPPGRKMTQLMISNKKKKDLNVKHHDRGLSNASEDGMSHSDPSSEKEIEIGKLNLTITTEAEKPTIQDQVVDVNGYKVTGASIQVQKMTQGTNPDWGNINSSQGKNNPVRNPAHILTDFVAEESETKKKFATAATDQGFPSRSKRSSTWSALRSNLRNPRSLTDLMKSQLPPEDYWNYKPEVLRDSQTKPSSTPMPPDINQLGTWKMDAPSFASLHDQNSHSSLSKVIPVGSIIGTSTPKQKSIYPETIEIRHQESLQRVAASPFEIPNQALDVSPEDDSHPAERPKVMEITTSEGMFKVSRDSNGHFELIMVSNEDGKSEDNPIIID